MTARLSQFYAVCSKISVKPLIKTLNNRNIHINTTNKSFFIPVCKKISVFNQNSVTKRNFNIKARLCGTPGANKPNISGGLSKQQAEELTLRLTNEERVLLLSALQEYQSKIVKDEYLGQLAANRWRSKFGRPSRLPSLGDVDPTGSYCPVPEDWLKKKYEQSVPSPTTKELIGICVANSIPFIGFGFLDNFIMIIAGDYIDVTLGSYLCLSTMAAAALGNTFSDVMGIGSAYYVERLATVVGFKPPKLNPIQLDMPISRQSANLGRAIGVTLGCLLGMFPLLFINADEDKNKQRISLEA